MSRQTAQQRIQDAERIADAETTLVGAQRDERDAQVSLNKARVDAARNIADLKAQLAGLGADQQQASADLASAQERLAQVSANDFSTPAELAQAQAAVAEAQAKVTTTAQQYKDVKAASQDANKAGVTGAQNVVDAQERLVDSQQAQVKAARDLKDAQRQQANDHLDQIDSARDAQDQLAQAQQRSVAADQAAGAAAANTGEKLTAISPAAQQVVSALRGLGPAFTSMRLDVQQSLLAGLGAQITRLGQNALPSLHQGLVGIAGELNKGASSFLSFAGDASTATQFDGLFANIRDSVGKLVPAVRPASQALLDLVSVGAGFGPQISVSISGFVQKISGAVSDAAKNGSLQAFFQRGLDALAQIAKIAGGVGRILGAVFAPAAQAGSVLLGVVGNITGRFADLLSSASGKKALGSLFDGLSDAAKALGPAISSVLATIVPVVQSLGPVLATVGKALAGGLQAAAPAIAPIAKAFASMVTSLAPLLPLLGQMVGQLLPPLAQLFGAVFTAVGPLVTALVSALQPVLPVIASLITSLSAALGPVITQLVGALTPILPKLAAAFGAALKAMAPMFPLLGQIFVALVPLIPPLAKIIVQMIQMFSKVAPAFIAVLKLVPPILRAIVPVVNVVINAVSGLIGIISRVIGWFSNLVTHITQVPGQIVRVGGAMLRAGASLMSNLFDGLKSALGKAGQIAVDVAKDIVNAIVGFINKIVIDPIKEFKLTIGALGFHHTFQPFGALPEIPRLSQGATVNPRDGGTLAVLAEGGKAESVVDTGLQNKQMDLMNRMAEKVLAGATGAGSTQIGPIYASPGQDVTTLAADISRRWATALNA